MWKGILKRSTVIVLVPVLGLLFCILILICVPFALVTFILFGDWEVVFRKFDVFKLIEFYSDWLYEERN